MESTEPDILKWGRSKIENFDKEVIEAFFKKIFGRGAPNSVIVLDDSMRCVGFRAAGVAWAVDQGLLYLSGSLKASQYTVWQFRLTEKGRQRFGPVV